MALRSAFRSRVRSSSISAAVPQLDSPDYNPDMAKAACSILYPSPLPSASGHPVYILNAAALPDTHHVEYDVLLPYVLARLPGEEDLIGGAEYEVVFFAGGNVEGAASTKKNRPGVGWFIQAYHVLSRAMRKRIQKLYIVHERTWVRMLVEVLGSIASPKFRKKIVHAATLTQLAQHIDISNLLIPPSAYLRDRQVSENVHLSEASGRRAFSAKPPLPRSTDGSSRLPRVLRETTNFLLMNLHTEGIFRIPAHVKLKDILREAYDRGQRYILWKERGVYLPFPHYENTPMHVDTNVLAMEIDQAEAYGVHLAASLLKFWYSELRDPVFPATCYKDLEQLYGNHEDPITVEKLQELLSPKSEWSIIPLTSREILTRHLLPLLSVIAARFEENKMTPENLAVCFAPTLCCSEDQLRDAKMSGILRRVLTAAIEQWSQGLREACGTDEAAFERDLADPARKEDYEDPLPVGSWRPNDEEKFGVKRPTSKDGFTEDQQTGVLSTGIVLQDNDIIADSRAVEDTAMSPPPLPPRQTGLVVPIPDTTATSGDPNSAPALPPRSPNSAVSPNSATSEPIRRKEVPLSAQSQQQPLEPRQPPLLHTQLPPRYTPALPPGTDADSITESPSAYVTPANGFGPRKQGDWSFEMSEGAMSREGSLVKRKAVGSGSETPVSASASRPVSGDWAKLDGGKEDGKE